jgi:hypothetical protein
MTRNRHSTLSSHPACIPPPSDSLTSPSRRRRSTPTPTRQTQQSQLQSSSANRYASIVMIRTRPSAADPDLTGRFAPEQPRTPHRPGEPTPGRAIEPPRPRLVDPTTRSSRRTEQVRLARAPSGFTSPTVSFLQRLTLARRCRRHWPLAQTSARHYGTADATRRRLRRRGGENASSTCSGLDRGRRRRRRRPRRRPDGHGCMSSYRRTEMTPRLEHRARPPSLVALR